MMHYVVGQTARRGLPHGLRQHAYTCMALGLRGVLCCRLLPYLLTCLCVAGSWFSHVGSHRLLLPQLHMCNAPYDSIGASVVCLANNKPDHVVAELFEPAGRTCWCVVTLSATPWQGAHRQ